MSHRRYNRVASAVQACRIDGASASCWQCKRVGSVVQACRVGSASVSVLWCKRGNDRQLAAISHNTCSQHKPLNLLSAKRILLYVCV